MLQSINEYLLKNWNIQDEKIQQTSIEGLKMTYKNYVNWEESGGKDLQLPGFFLTNRQMFWVAVCQKIFFKFHSHYSENLLFNLIFQNYHLQFKHIDYFREAFNCAEITEDEKEVFRIFKEDLKILAEIQSNATNNFLNNLG